MVFMNIKISIVTMIFLLIFTNLRIYADSETNELFIDADRICGFWSLDQNKIDTERNLRMECYTITREKSEDYFNKYVGKIAISIGGGADVYKIIRVEKINSDEYMMYVGMTYGGIGEYIPRIAYGRIRLKFINNDTIYFERAGYDPSGGGYLYDFIGSNVLCYRAIVDNNIKEQDKYIPLPYMATHIVIKDHVPLYHDRPPVNNDIVMYLNSNDEVQVIIHQVLSTRLQLEYEPVTRDGITAPLVYVKTADGQTGFCFLIYLEKIE
jgi:hypothetical protein